MIKSPYQKYQQSSIQTASPAQLLIMLYDGAIRFVRLGIDGIEKEQYDVANTNLIKAQAVINELIASLDTNYEISSNLSQIYEYFIYQIIQANIRKQAQPAREVLGLLQQLKLTWEEASKQIPSKVQTNYV